MSTYAITINSGAKTIDAESGGLLIEALSAQGIHLPSACGSTGRCGLCRLKVLDGGGEATPAERKRLGEAALVSGMRLACQIRVGSPLRIELPVEYLTAQEYSCSVHAKRVLTHDIVELTLRLESPSSIVFIPGQYVLLLSGALVDGKPVTRPFSIASSPSTGDRIQLNVRLNPKGVCTPWIFNDVKEGDRLSIRGPRGAFFLRNTTRPIVFVGGGSGMAPVRSILRSMSENGIDRPATFFFGAVGKADLFYLDEMHALERELPGFRFVPALSGSVDGSEWQGERGLITEAMDRLLRGDCGGTEAYLCGKPEMINACVPILERKGIAKADMFYDLFTPAKAPATA